MNKTLFLFFILWTLVITLYPENEKVIELNLEKKFSLGQKEIFFDSITSVYEDKMENFYVLDHKAYKLYKFSKNGKMLISFGERGRGPGDFSNPHSVHITPEGNIAVNEVKDFVSIFDNQGKFLTRIKVSRGLDLNLINNNLFYVWIWTPGGKQQALVNKNGKILKSFFSVSREEFSINAADEKGRSVMINNFAEEYTPFLLFNQYKNYSIVGITNKYKILLLNKNGEILNEIYRDIKPGIISQEEKEYFKNEININRKLPDFAKKKFIKKIPKYKNYFNHILISEPYFWIFRIKENIVNQNSLVPVDLYTFNMKFRGTLKIKKIPLFISPKYIYFEETKRQEDLLLVKYKYSIGF